MTEVGGEDDGAGVAGAEIQVKGDPFAGEDPRGVLLAILRRRAILDQRDVAGDEGDFLEREARSAAADGRQDAPPVRIAAVRPSAMRMTEYPPPPRLPASG